MSKQRNTDCVEVWLVEPGQGRPPFAFNPKKIEFLPPDQPLPQVGDVVLLPRKVTGDTKELELELPRFCGQFIATKS